MTCLLAAADEEFGLHSRGLKTAPQLSLALALASEQTVRFVQQQGEAAVQLVFFRACVSSRSPRTARESRVAAWAPGCPCDESPRMEGFVVS